MEEEIQYSTMEFKNDASAPKNNKEELTVYSSLTIPNPLTSETQNKEEDAVYSQVAPQIFPSETPNQKEPVYSEIKKGKQKRKKENAPTKKNPEADFDPISKETKPDVVVTEFQGCGSRFRLLLVCLGIICFLLFVAIIIIIICFTMETNKQKQNLSDLEVKIVKLNLDNRNLQTQNEDLNMNMTKLENKTEDLRINMTKLQNQNEYLRINMTNFKNQTEQLTTEKQFLENQTKEMTVNMTIQQTQINQLRNISDKLNRTKAAIIRYNTFPLDLFCSDGVCQVCPKNWILFNESCYYFYNNSDLKTWSDSRQLCKNINSDLVVISSLEEQTFIKNRIEYYTDTWKGYLIGLRRINNNWIWVDNSTDTLGYWNNPGSSDNFARIINNATLTQSWYIDQSGNLNKFICEIKAFIF